MRSEKTDVRSRFTQSLIKDSLLKLLKSSELKNVTVAEICKTAQINRGTFYNHFYDIIDVYDSMEDEFLERVLEKLNSVKMLMMDYFFIKDLIDIISQNLDFVKIVLTSGGQSTLFSRLIDYVKNKYIRELSEKNSSIDYAELTAFFTYAVNGSIAVFIEWLKKDVNHSSEEIAKQIDKFNDIMMKGIFR